jgi:DNA processing protein
MKTLTEKIPELYAMKSYPKELFYEGNLALLKKTKISIVGSRKPSKYSRTLTHQLSFLLSKNGICVVSGAAMGIDAVAHLGAGSANTIAVLPCGIDVKYPVVNKNLLYDIQNNGLLLSQFPPSFKAAVWSFVVRNELVVAIGDVLVVAEAELSSGSMRSIEYALTMGKEIYAFPHRLGESNATNALAKEGKVKIIYDLEEFVARFATTSIPHAKKDDFLEFCKTAPTYEEAVQKYPERVFVAELSGEIEIIKGSVFLKS